MEENLLASELLFDGRGNHVCGVFPRLMEEDNQLTVAYFAHKIERPGASIVGPETDYDNLGLVYMAPLELGVFCAIPDAALGAMVFAVDAGQRIIVHACDQLAADYLTQWVKAFLGGGHV